MTDIPGPLVFAVAGIPAPQGSKRLVGHGHMIESSSKVKPWREAVKWAALAAISRQGWQTTIRPVEVTITFLLARPKKHYRTGRCADQLRDDAPTWVNRTPDLSKLVRSTEDALTEAGVWRDDAQAVVEHTEKRWAGDDLPPGALITIQVLDDSPAGPSAGHTISVPANTGGEQPPLPKEDY